jgi:hypothetical protein
VPCETSALVAKRTPASANATGTSRPQPRTFTSHPDFGSANQTFGLLPLR